MTQTQTRATTAPVVRQGPRRAVVVGLSVLAGLAVAVLWSARLVDDDIGVNVANGVLGQDAATATVTGTVAGLLFAITTGVAGTFTACNVAVFSAVAPMAGTGRTLRPLGWLTLSAVVVAGGYGAIGAVVGDRLPQLSDATFGDGHPVRVLQSIAVFGVIGLVLVYLGLAAIGVVPDPLARASRRWAPTRNVVMGVLIGAFLIGRPWPLFRTMFQHAADTHDPAFGAAVFVLIALGNMVLMGLLFLLLSATRFPRWLREKPARAATVTAVALLVGGTFTFAYWDIRVPAGLGFGWFPMMPWH